MGRSTKLVLFIGGGLAVGLGLGFLPDWLSLLVLLGVLTGALAASHRVQQLSQVRGWFEGRGALYQSLIEAEKRGMDTTDWLSAEIERDRIYFFEHALSRRERKKMLAAESAEQSHGDGGDSDGDHQ